VEIQNHSYYPKHIPLSDIPFVKVRTKKGNVYTFLKWFEKSSEVNDELYSSISTTVQGRKFILTIFKMEGQKERPILFTKVGRGWVVSDQLFHYKPTQKYLKLITEIEGGLWVDDEKVVLGRLMDPLQRIFSQPKYVVSLEPTGDERNKIEFKSERVKRNWLETTLYTERIPDRIEPDFMVEDKKRCTHFYIEVELSERNVEEIVKKYWRLHYLDKKVYYIFKNEYIAEHYKSALRLFEGRSGRTFKSIHYALLEEVHFICHKSIFRPFGHAVS
jgi:hypothetical protein